MGTVCMDYPRGQKKASEPPETVSHMWVLGLEPRSSGKAACVLYPLSSLSNACLFYAVIVLVDI